MGGIDKWTISVKDNGIGIPQQYQERVFGLFKCLHGRNFPGTVSGVAVCTMIVERHGGRIWIESAGPGTTVKFAPKAG